MSGQQRAIYDLRGLKCPLPALKVTKKLAFLSPGSLLIVDTTDPLAPIDIQHVCNQHGHEMVSVETREDGHRFTIRRGEASKLEAEGR